MGILTKFSIVVVDDGSTDGTSEAICKQYPSVILLQGNGRLWWTGAIKMGMQYAVAQCSDFVIWLNDDCMIGANTIDGIVNSTASREHRIVGGIGYESAASSEVAFGGKQRTQFGYNPVITARKGLHSCDLLSGNLVCMPVKIVDDIGYPDPSACPHYGGDSLFLIKARNAGYSLLLDNRHPAVNACRSCGSRMNPDKWLTGNLSTRNLFSLLFDSRSMMSFKVWWFLYIEDYGAYGILLFLSKFSALLGRMFVISVLRLLPISMRKKLSLIKRNIFSRD